MVASPELLKQRPEPEMTVASLDAKHRVHRRAMMQALQPLICARPPAEESLKARLLWESHLERAAIYRAEFYQLRLRQLAERQALIEDITSRAREEA